MDQTMRGGLADEVERYLAWNRDKGHLPGSVATYASALRRFVRAYPDGRVADFEPPAGTDLIRAAVLDDGRANDSVSRDLSILSNFFRWCDREEGLIHGDPTIRIARPPRKPRPVKIIPEAHLTAIISAAATEREQLVLRILFEVGAQQVELTHIQMRDYDPLTDTLTLRDDTGTERVVPVTDPALQTDLEAYRQAQYARLDRTATARDTRRVDTEYLFCSRGHPDRPITRSGARKWWKRTLRKAGLPDRYSMLDARRTARAAAEIPVPRPAAAAALVRAVAKAPDEYRSYLEEAVGCFESGFYRASIIMVWNAVMQHLYGLVDAATLAAIDAEHKRRNHDGQRGSYRKLKKIDDLRYLPEGTFIELAEAAGIYDRNARALLEGAHKTRHTCAHPTGRAPGEVQAGNFIESLITDILNPNGMIRPRPRQSPRPRPPQPREEAESDLTLTGEGIVVAVRSRDAIPMQIRREVWRRDQARCVDCGAQERLEYDHIIPVSKGGSNTARNIQLRCESCNRKKGARI